MENALVVLWRHVEYYLGTGKQSRATAWPEDDMMWEDGPTLTRAEMNTLKQDAAALQLPNTLKRLTQLSKSLAHAKTGDLFYLLSSRLKKELLQR
jgi:hypothetical protein